jgi:hypothetical protein
LYPSTNVKEGEGEKKKQERKRYAGNVNIQQNYKGKRRYNRERFIKNCLTIQKCGKKDGW